MYSFFPSYNANQSLASSPLGMSDSMKIKEIKYNIDYVTNMNQNIAYKSDVHILFNLLVILT